MLFIFIQRKNKDAISRIHDPCLLGVWMPVVVVVTAAADPRRQSALVIIRLLAFFDADQRNESLLCRGRVSG